jgi:hypothetical protein
MNSSIMCLILCKNFCKCHSVPPPNTTIKNKKEGYSNTDTGIFVAAWSTVVPSWKCAEYPSVDE